MAYAKERSRSRSLANLKTETKNMAFEGAGPLPVLSVVLKNNNVKRMIQSDLVKKHARRF